MHAYVTRAFPYYTSICVLLFAVIRSCVVRRCTVDMYLPDGIDTNKSEGFTDRLPNIREKKI